MRREETKMESEKERFITNELALATALISNGFEFIGAEGYDPRRFDFVFIGSVDILQAEAAYYRGELMVEAGGFHNALRKLKRIIRQKRNRE